MWVSRSPCRREVICEMYSVWYKILSTPFQFAWLNNLKPRGNNHEAETAKTIFFANILSKETYWLKVQGIFVETSISHVKVFYLKVWKNLLSRLRLTLWHATKKAVNTSILQRKSAKLIGQIPLHDNWENWGHLIWYKKMLNSKHRYVDCHKVSSNLECFYRRGLGLSNIEVIIPENLPLWFRVLERQKFLQLTRRKNWVWLARDQVTDILEYTFLQDLSWYEGWPPAQLYCH